MTEAPVLRHSSPDGKPPGLRIAMVSDTSVARGGIYGMRIARLARELADLGHQVVLLSPTAPKSDMAPAPSEFQTTLGSHDWSSPMMVWIQPDASRTPRNRFSLIRKLVTVWAMLRHGGTDRAWQSAASSVAEHVARDFRPHVVFATFGTSSNLAVAQHLAQCASAPWVADMKDNVDIYINRWVRGPLRWQFRDVAALISNADLHAAAAARWFGRDVAVIRSGIADAMLASPESRPDRETFLITLIGSVYDSARVSGFLSALHVWLERQAPEIRACVRFRYAGIDAARVEQILAAHPLGCPVTVTGNIPHGDLAHLCHSAALNCYIWEPLTFHHKLLELLSCRRPVLSYPGEHPESMVMARKARGLLFSCGNANAVLDALDTAFSLWTSGVSPVPDLDADAFTWQRSSRDLEAVFYRVIGADGS